MVDCTSQSFTNLRSRIRSRFGQDSGELLGAGRSRGQLRALRTLAHSNVPHQAQQGRSGRVGRRKRPCLCRTMTSALRIERASSARGTTRARAASTPSTTCSTALAWKLARRTRCTGRTWPPAHVARPASIRRPSTTASFAATASSHSTRQHVPGDRRAVAGLHHRRRQGVLLP